MLSLNRTRHISFTVLMLGMSSIAGCAGSSEHGALCDAEVEGAEIGAAESALTVMLPRVFTATLQNASRDGSTNECLMFYGGATEEYPSRYLWGSDNGYCGFASKAALLANKQAVWKFTRLDGDQYTISHAAGDGSTNACLMFYGVATEESPTRYSWGSDNGYCGFASKADVLANKQAVWKVKPRGGNKFTISHALTNECLIFGSNGQAGNPARHLWGGGDNGNCGWDSEANLLANKQAIWTLTVQETLDLTSASCADVKAQYLDADDGDYTLEVAGGPATIYCADVAGTPKEYLALEHTGGLSNYSRYTAGGASPGSDVVTYYEKVRIDPSTLLVDISDQRFATSTGQLYHSGTELVTSMPFAIAMSCDSGASGQANIDLRGTPFSVAANEFMQAGYAASGTSVYSESHQVVDLTGGGYCGWTNPVPYAYNPFNGAGGFQLNLVYGAN